MFVSVRAVRGDLGSPNFFCWGGGATWGRLGVDYLRVLLLGVDHLLRHAAVDGDALAVDEIALRVAEEQTRAGNILRAANTSREVKGVVLGAKNLILVDAYPAWCYAVDGDVVGC